MANELNKAVRDTNDLHRAARGSAESETVQSVDRVLATVELLLRTGVPLTVREVAAGTGIDRTTAHRLLGSLHRRGWIERVVNSAACCPGVHYLALARAPQADRDFIDEVKPTMERLSLLSRETVHRSILDNHDPLHITKVDSPEIIGVSSRVEIRAAPHVIGLCKALLASGPDEELEAYIEHARQRSSSPPDFAAVAFRTEIALARRRGYSIDDGESLPGVRCLAVVIRGMGGSPLVATSLTGPSGRFTMERVASRVPEMLAVAHELTTRFGGEANSRPKAVA